MEIKFFKKDCTNCNECLLKDRCNSKMENRSKTDRVKPCSVCTKRCNKYVCSEREWDGTCYSKNCMFELDVNEAWRIK